MTSSPSLVDTETEAARRARGRRKGRQRRRREAAGRGNRVAVAALAVAVLGTGVGLGVVYNNKTQPDAGALTDHPRRVDVFLDGWSKQTLGDAKLGVEVGGEAAAALDFAPVSRADVDELLKSSPDIVVQALARQFDASASLTCDAAGCRTDMGSVDPYELLLETGSERAEGLKALGVTSGLWRASVNGDRGAGTFTFHGQGQPSFTVVADDEAATPGRYLLSAGLGRIWQADAQWLGGTQDAATLEVEGDTDVEATLAAVTNADDALAATTGLGAEWDLARYWTPSQLTIATSPSRGCRAAILCFPGVVPGATSEVFDRENVAVTDGDRDAVVGFEERVTTASLPAPIWQVGHEGMISGDIALRTATAVLYAGEGEKAIDWAGYIALDDGQSRPMAEVLDNVRLWSTKWHAK